MQLMTFNSLLMFDIVFIFFLFLVGVTCLVYYLPPRELPPPPLVPSAASDHNDHPTTTHTTAAGGTITCAHHQHRRHHQHLHHGCIERCGHRSPVAGDVAVAPAAGGMMVQSCAAAARRISGEGGTPVLVQNERSTTAGSSPSGNPMESDSFGASQGRRLERPLRLECCSVADRQQGGTSVETPPPAYHEQRLELGCCNSNQPGQQLQFERFVQIEVDSSSIDGGGGVSSKVAAAAAAAAATPCCYVRAKASDIKECHGPICDV
ncbi:uncharacterized protein LOC125959438 [Anopheles darlingi]|uniref:uncharacterized protein LOC125959438 n=1 Tax=Anopheles darlingi TaxID=43151 RepID=UPI0021005A3C|nr:uncharacterized protein LOC125959438 [Anopheles darlingi]